MIFRYVVRNLSRRKVRSLMMVLSLVVGVGALAALNATVDSYRRYFAGTVAGEVGDFDLVVRAQETATSPFLDTADLTGRIAAVGGVREVAPRVHGVVSLSAGSQTGDVLMVALDPARDTFGIVEASAGDYDLASTPAGVPGAFV
ncbi:MAG: ABC transporter permease, partial [Anaerolineae bacterium]